MCKEVIVTCMEEYIKQVTELSHGLVHEGSWKYEIILFRGQADKNYSLLPAVARCSTGPHTGALLSEERNLIEMAKFRLPDVFHASLTPVELLARLQHHGIPTRLLDVTENALVALYFACSEKIGAADGEVIVFQENEQDVNNYPIVNAIADSYRFARGRGQRLSSFFKNVITQPYFLEQKQLNEFLKKKGIDDGKRVAQICQKPIFLYAPIHDLRQQMQQGRYLLFPNHVYDGKHGHKCFSDHIEAMSKNHECIQKRIIISKEKKRQLLQDLRLLGVSKDALFCDNIDVVCESIKNRFQEKAKVEDYG